MNRKALLVFNPHARQVETNLPEVRKALQNLNFDWIEYSIEDPHQLSEKIQQFQFKVDLVIVAGGDGTLNAAIEGLIQTQLPLGILPLGTANDLARTLRIPNSIPEACQIIAQGTSRRIDLGWVNGKHFFNVASIGLSVQITQNLSKEVKRRWGIFAYALTALKVLWKTRPFRAKIWSNGESIRVKTIQIAVGNGRHYGGGMTVAEDATIHDQRLDLYSLELKSRSEIICLLPAMRQGNQANWPNVRSLTGTEFAIYTRKPHDINTDGEITTQTPAQFRVIPEAIAVFIPSQTDLSNG
jgi:diacylglycerol kinase (ATP)